MLASPIVAHSRTKDNYFYVDVFYNMPYFSLRITPQYLVDLSASSIFRKIECLYDVEYFSLGYELLNKLLEPTKPHYHYHFFSKKKELQKATIQKELNRLGVMGKDAYCLQDPSQVDQERFFRYPMKEKLLDCRLPFPTERIKELEAIAIDERKRAAEFHKAKKKANKKRASLFERLVPYLDEYTQFYKWCPIYIMEHIVMFYCEEDRPLNARTINGYVDLYLLKRGVISPRDYAEQYRDG